MKLLDRYLHAVGQYLPAETKEDTLAELRANLLAQMDGREEELGRPLTEQKVAEVLRAHGKPEVVAVRYLPQRSLIGPTVFPFYLFTLKRALPLVILIYTIARTAEIATNHPEQLFAVSLVQAVLQFFPVLLTFWAVVTLVFASIEAAARGKEIGDWDPNKLPTVTDKAQSKTWRVADLIVHILLVAYVGSVPYHPYLVLGPGAGYLDRVPVGLSPEWHIFYLGIVVLLVMQLVLKVVSLSPITGTTQATLDLVVKAMGVGILCILVGARVYFIPRGAAEMHGIDSLNAVVGLCFKIVLVMTAVDLARGIWKATRGVGSGGAKPTAHPMRG